MTRASLEDYYTNGIVFSGVIAGTLRVTHTPNPSGCHSRQNLLPAFPPCKIVEKVENPAFPVDYAYGKRALCGKPSQRKKSQNAP